MRRPILLTAGTLAGLAGTVLANPSTRAQLISSAVTPLPGRPAAIGATARPTTAQRHPASVSPGSARPPPRRPRSPRAPWTDSP